MRRILFESKTEFLWIKIEVYQMEDDKVVIHGYDSGKIVKEIRHKFDSEYYLTIKKNAVLKLRDKLGLKNVKELFDWFEKEYSTDKAVSQIRKKLNELKIENKFSIW